MDRSLSAAAGLVTFALVLTALCSPARVSAQSVPAQTAPTQSNLTQTKDVPSVRRVQILPSQGAVEIEIEGSDRLVPQAQVLTGPDRLVVDFPNAVPGAQLRNQAVNRGEVKDVRVGLFASKPPVTRIVLDLTGPESYQIFPYGRTVMVKVGGGAGTKTAELNSAKPPAPPGLVNTSFPAQPVPASLPPAPSKPPLRVTFNDGLLTISSNKASLSEILFEVHERTGADIAIPAGAEQEKVAAEFGPGPAPEVLAHLLNGSSFNFLILSAEGGSGRLDRVILSPRTEGGVSAPPAPMPGRQPAPAPDDADADTPPPPSTPPPAPPAESIQSPTNPGPPPGTPPGPRQVPNTPPDTKAPENNDSPD